MKTQRIKVFESRTEADLFLPEGKVYPVTSQGKKICLVRYKDSIHAYPDKCPHESYPLSKGYCTKEGELVCPWHKYSFDLQSGQRTNGRGYFIKPLQVLETDTGIYVEWPLSWLEALLA
ncbi:MAG: Rieske 2Fe-2S domain-containing protein [Bacteroidia bacterium]|nr:Rieske 2Fe-2S domain-containing protein [Bacteroidia bacterium]